MTKAIRFVSIFALLIGFSFGGNIDINDVSIRFCSNTSEKLEKHISLYNRAGEITKECILIVNKSENTGYIDLHFVSQVNSSQGKKACAIPGTENDVFSRYIHPDRSGLIYLGSKEEIKKNFELAFPVGMGGTQGGCLAFFIVQENKTKKIGGTFLSLITRKASLFEVWIDDAKSFINKIRTEKNGKSERVFFVINGLKSQVSFNNIDKSLRLRLKIINDGNLDQRLHLSGSIYSFLGFEKKFDINEKILKKDMNLVFDTKNEGINLNVPEYHGLFGFKLNLGNQPYFDFDTSRIPDEKLSWSSNKTNIVFFVISWISVSFWLLVIFFVFIIYRIIRKKLTIKKGA